MPSNRAAPLVLRTGQPQLVHNFYLPTLDTFKFKIRGSLILPFYTFYHSQIDSQIALLHHPLSDFEGHQLNPPNFNSISTLRFAPNNTYLNKPLGPNRIHTRNFRSIYRYIGIHRARHNRKIGFPHPYKLEAKLLYKGPVQTLSRWITKLSRTNGARWRTVMASG